MEPFVINPDNVPSEVADTFTFRESCRGIVLDTDGNIGVLHSQNENFYKLAGGGVELGETLLQAFEREVQEELGVTVTNITELCSVLEIRIEQKLRQVSHCFIANVVGDKGDTELEGWELVHNMRHEWIPARTSAQIY